MDFVVIESPLASDDREARIENMRYARACLKNSMLRGEAPFASHLLYTQALDDLKPAEREAGLVAAMAVIARADRVAVYVDRGMSEGMRRGISEALRLGIPVTYRSDKKPAEELPLAHIAYTREKSETPFLPLQPEDLEK